ncbi:MAG: hypothetical protein ACOC44_03645 [Promethearchaeia archaeon]
MAEINQHERENTGKLDRNERKGMMACYFLRFIPVMGLNRIIYCKNRAGRCHA